MDETKEKREVSREAMTAIIATAIVAVLCIVACTAVLITFILKGPWG